MLLADGTPLEIKCPDEARSVMKTQHTIGERYNHGHTWGVDECLYVHDDIASSNNRNCSCAPNHNPSQLSYAGTVNKAGFAHIPMK